MPYPTAPDQSRPHPYCPCLPYNIAPLLISSNVIHPIPTEPRLPFCDSPGHASQRPAPSFLPCAYSPGQSTSPRVTSLQAGPIPSCRLLPCVALPHPTPTNHIFPYRACLTLPWQILLIVQVIQNTEQVNNAIRYRSCSIFITRPTPGRYVNLPRRLRNRQTQFITQCFEFFRFHLSCLNAIPGSTCY